MGNLIRKSFCKYEMLPVFIQPDGRYVVKGIKGREHIFEADGELVTSFYGSNKAHLTKLRTGKRRAITINEFLVFQEIFQ